MKIKNNTSENISVICHNGEVLCQPGQRVEIDSANNEIYIKSTEQKSALCHFKIFKHIGKDSIKGNVTYFNPGFFFKYATKMSLSPEIKEINIVKYDIVISSLLICSVFLPKEKIEKEFLFDNSIVKKALCVFVCILLLPWCVASGLLGFISACGIIFDFDWSLVVATVIFLLFFSAFISIFRNLYRCTNPVKHYAGILEDGKQVIIQKNTEHFLSYVETDYLSQEYSLKK